MTPGVGNMLEAGPLLCQEKLKHSKVVTDHEQHALFLVNQSNCTLLSSLAIHTGECSVRP